MKSKALLILLLLFACCGMQMKANAQDFGMENNGDGSYTIWIGNGSITTNTDGEYSASSGEGTYCTGCYATPVYGSTEQQAYSPEWSFQPLAGTPPAPGTYTSTNIVGTNEEYYDANGNVVATIPFGINTASMGTGIIGYEEGCATCAQQSALDQAGNQWNSSLVSAFDAQPVAYQGQITANMQAQMDAAFNQGNAYNYYYFYYALQYQVYNACCSHSIPPPSSLPPPPPPPPVPPTVGAPEDKLAASPITVAKLPADLGGNRTYVTPSGTPFTLPSGAQVGNLILDMGDFTNGALYDFYVNGKHYMAFESYYGPNNGSEPTFGGYFEVGPDGKCDLTKPYPVSPGDYLPITTTPINVVRIRNTTNPCAMSQDIVSYTPAPNTPGSIPGMGGAMQQQSGQIETSDPVAGTPTASVPTGCPVTGADNNSGTELQNYIQHGGFGRFIGFLNTNMKNTAKVYLYDCNTGKAKYEVTKTGLQTLTSAQSDAETNKFEQGTFSSSDEDIAIKGCISNGKWQTQVKLNPTKLTPNSKIAPVLGAVEAEIDAEAQAEALKYASVGKYTNDETFDAGNGETFKKQGMDIWGALSAIYDVGKDVINDGHLPEKIWDGGNRASGPPLADVAAAHSKSPFQMPTLITGGVDELINQTTGAVQLVKAGLEFVRNPIKTATSIWNGVKTLDGTKIMAILSAATGADNVTAGGDRLKYQTGHYGVQLAMIFVSGLESVSEGTQVVDGAGKDISDIQTFVPDGGTDQSVSNILKTASSEGEAVEDLESKVLVTKNLENGTEEHVMTIDKAENDIYDSKALQSLDDIPEDVMEAAESGDIAQAAESPILHDEMKNQPQQFKDGKTFEKNVNSDVATHNSRITEATGIDVSQYTRVEQVQVKMADGTWIVADNVYYKPVPGTTNQFDVIINETKLGPSAPFSENQTNFINEVQSGTTTFELRTSKFTNSAVPMPKGAQLNVQSLVKTVGDGTPGGVYAVTKIH